MSTLLIKTQTIPFIFTTNYSPPSSGNHRSLFVKLAKRGKQRAGGEALLLSLYSVNEMILLCNSVLTEAEFYIFLIVFFSLLLSQHYTFINK